MTPAGNWHFLVKLHLQDATGELDAVIFGNEGSTFFGVSPPRNPSALEQTLLCHQDGTGMLG